MSPAPLRALPAGTGALAPFVRAGVLGALEVHWVAAVGRLAGGLGPEEQLALGCALRATRLGHVGLELADVGRLAIDADDALMGSLEWPERTRWEAILGASRIVAAPSDHELEPVRPLVWDGRRLYLQRYFDLERATASALAGRASVPPMLAGGGADALERCLDAVFGTDAARTDLQREAAHRALTAPVSVIAGGPGTGKTHTVARILAAAHLAPRRDVALRVVLAAPTGKAAARMLEAVRQQVGSLAAAGALPVEAAARIDATPAMTVHRLLGASGRSRFRHDRRHPLAYDLVVVDETSMLSLPLLRRLLDALAPAAHLVLVGDPSQLASIEVGTVMADLVGPDPLHAAGPLAGRVSVLEHVHRFTADSGVAALGAAVRRGDAAHALEVLGGGSPDVAWVRPEDEAGRSAVERVVVDGAVEVVTRALRGDAAGALAAASSIKVLAARRQGRLSRDDWSERIEAAVAAQVGAFTRSQRWAVGRPVMVTANDPLIGVANGDVGVVVADGNGVAVALQGATGVELRSTAQLPATERWWAMTIHKAQGSEFGHAVVSLADATSPVLSRELLYTAVTRAPRITVVAGEAALRTAIARPVARASGLGELLWSNAPRPGAPG